MEKAYIPAGMKIKGDVISEGDLCLAGEIEGNVSIDGTLELNGSVKGKKIKVGRIELTKGTIESDIECDDYIGIGKGVTVVGNIKAGNADVDGAVLGNLDVREKAYIGSAAVVKGRVVAGEVAIDLGAVCDIDLEKSYRSEKAADFFKEYMEKHNISDKKPAEAKAKKTTRTSAKAKKTEE